MKKLSLLLALACSLSACASYPPGSPATGARTSTVGVMTLNEGPVQATIGMHLGGSATRRVMEVLPWTAANLSEVRVHLFRATTSVPEWVQVGTGAGLPFTQNLGGPLTLTFSGLARETSYRIVAIAYGDDGQHSSSEVGQPEPDVGNLTSGSRRADKNFARSVSEIAQNQDYGNQYTFTTGTETTQDLRTNGDATVFQLVLRDKYQVHAASGVSVAVQAGNVYPQIMLLTTTLHQLGATPDHGGVVKVAAATP